MAVEFDGTAYLRRASNLFGIESGKTFTISVWVKAEDGEGGVILNGASALAEQKIQLSQSVSSGTYSILVRNAAHTIIWQATTSLAYDDGEWHNVLVAASLADNEAHLIIDGASDESTVVAPTDDTIAFAAATEWEIGAGFGGGSTVLTAVLDSIYFTTEYIDISDPDNERLFYGRDGAKIGLGPGGRRPSASDRRPEILLTHGPGNFGRNEGSGGDFGIVGSLDLANGRPAATNSLSRSFRGERWRESERSGIPFPESQLVLEPASGLEVARREFSTDRDEINRNRRRNPFPE